jgi:hypothetical protein
MSRFGLRLAALHDVICNLVFASMSECGAAASKTEIVALIRDCFAHLQKDCLANFGDVAATAEGAVIDDAPAFMDWRSRGFVCDRYRDWENFGRSCRKRCRRMALGVKSTALYS